MGFFQLLTFSLAGYMRYQVLQGLLVGLSATWVHGPIFVDVA